MRHASDGAVVDRAARILDRSRCRAFTLAEMLIVLAVIVLLMAVLVPAFRGVRHSARATTCLSNMRNLATAHVAYTMDFNGLFADVGLPHGGPPVDEPEAWFHTLEPYYAAAPVLHSPLDDSVHWPADQGGTGTPVPGSADRLRKTSYGWNNYLSRKFTPATALDGVVADRMSKIPNAASTVHFLCMATTGAFAGADHVHVENWDSGTGTPPPGVIAASQMQTNIVSGKPQSGDARSNMSFVDGHVESKRFAEVYVNLELNSFDPRAAGRMLARFAVSAAP